MTTTTLNAAEIVKRNEKIVAAYAKGATVPQLSKKFGLSTIMVYRYLKALGVSLRPRADGKPKASGKAASKTSKASKSEVGMPDEVKVMLAERRRQEMADDEAERIAKMEAYRPLTWRRRALAQYVARVLAVRGGERLDFMDRNPIGEVFR